MALARIFLCTAVICLGCALCYATIFGTVRGIVHDPQHRPISGAQVTLESRSSQWTMTTTTDPEGVFQFEAVPLGNYLVKVSHPGFEALEQTFVVQSGSAPILHFSLNLERLTQRVEISAGPEAVRPESSTTESVIDRRQIEETPGADRTNSLAMITNYVPGAYLVHDQLHIRGGHQVSWLIDGVPVPNTNIASNVGPQLDPKDIDYLEVQRGGYSAEYGDRTYGIFNVVTRSGFERSREAELVASFGSFQQTNDQISFGSHTDRFAYYASLSGNRAELGLQTPTPEVLHDLSSGESSFASLIFNATSRDQLRLVTSLRRDHFQVPNSAGQQAAGIRDVENEADAFVNFSWVHTAGRGLLLTVSPFYHFNRAHFIGGPEDAPIIPESDRGSQYAGGQVTLAGVKGKHNARAGFLGFAQRDNALFGIAANDGSGLALRQRERLWGSVSALFFEDQYRATSWLALNGGLRLTHYSAARVENAASPRAGATLRIPKLGWLLRGFYGRYYQAPPLSTVSGPLLDFALQQGFGFLPLRGERDEQYEAGLTIPISGWVLDADYFHTAARNFFDHDVLGNSNVFFPLTIAGARIRGWEATVRSPELFQHARIGRTRIGHARIHLAYSHQFAEGIGGVTGGLTDFSPPPEGTFFLDHDQRNTLNAGFRLDLPWHSWASANVSYGSGFLDGNGPSHLPAHTTLDLSFSKSLGEKLTLGITGLNIANRRYLLDNSNTFGGTHFNDPRQVIVQLRYRFHY